MQIFEQRTGTFLPLSDDQIGSLTEAQAAAYIEVANTTRALADAEAELETAAAQVKSDLAVLADAEKNAPRFDRDAARVALVKEMIASNRVD
jgi:hypothetical protein